MLGMRGPDALFHPQPCRPRACRPARGASRPARCLTRDRPHHCRRAGGRMQPAPPRPAARLVDLGLQLLPARHAEAVAVAARARPARAQPARKLVAAQVRQHRAAAGLGVQQALRGQDALRARDRDRVRVGQPPTSRRDFMRADVPAGTRRARARLRCARKPMRGSQGGDSALRSSRRAGPAAQRGPGRGRAPRSRPRAARRRRGRARGGWRRRPGSAPGAPGRPPGPCTRKSRRRARRAARPSAAAPCRGRRARGQGQTRLRMGLVSSRWAKYRGASPGIWHLAAMQ